MVMRAKSDLRYICFSPTPQLAQCFGKQKWSTSDSHSFRLFTCNKKNIHMKSSWGSKQSKCRLSQIHALRIGKPRYSAVGIVTALYTGQSGESLFDSRARQELYLFSEADTPALGHISTLQRYDTIEESIRKVRAMRHGAEHLQCC